LRHNLSFDLFEGSIYFSYDLYHLGILGKICLVYCGYRSISIFLCIIKIWVQNLFDQIWMNIFQITIQDIREVSGRCTTTLLIGPNYDFMFFIVHDVFMFLIFNLVPFSQFHLHVIMFTTVGVEGKIIL
ncbi:hypothetical protein ACJX0J_037515, partial [Zea mays]